ncbi:MAG: putative Zn-dependent protease/ribosomal 50S subunit-associated protein YjgA (DUF615 family) [Planctomycetota bacterium]|jgi:predicted Zn-dependent protease/ribosomal 50S subunit-associated protein YjgA (DUF615 family)
MMVPNSLKSLHLATSVATWIVLATTAAAAPTSIALAAFEPEGSTGEALDESLAERVDAILAGDLDKAGIGAAVIELYDLAIATHGDLAELDAHLEQRATDSEKEQGSRVALRLSAYLSWRHGDLDDSLADFESLAQDESDLDARLARARVMDANGQAKDALVAYEEIIASGALANDEELATRLQLRMALMSMESGEEEHKDALIQFASAEGRPIALRNRCATVLALLGRPGDAADLYVVIEPPPGDMEISARKKQLKASANGELRVAEWALRAEDFPRAQGAAWRALHLTTVAREKRYALTLLAEAHRGDESLAALLERFSSERDGLPKEARRAWIELLRETGSTDAAIAMTQGDQAETFTREERRRLLEMYREAERDDEMIAVYRDWIATEPEELVWRQGLARHYLEEGDRDSAIGVWEDWFTNAGDAPVEERARALDAADVLESLGLDGLATRAAEVAVASGKETESALLFLYDLNRDRGRLEDARAALDRLDQSADPGSPARMPLSDCLERLGELEEAIRVLEGVREARGIGNAGEDLEMRLAWLYSEVGREEQALELWKDIWTRVQSIARRRFVEDRLMTVASRLGVLADIAVELERKLYDGRADQKDTGLLVRLYTKVGDAVSAAEIVDEFLRRSGGTELEALTEKARVYLACNDYYHYEKAVAELVEIDPEGRPDYYRQLAMSQLERGKPDQARATLMNLQDLPGGDDSSAEFEAGVLALSGMRDEAISAYRRGLAAHPERIDSYLLMANLLKEVRQAGRAVGMFQHLAETAERDDLFTIAIDGLMNMLVDAPPRPKMTEWARRITLERLAAKEDRPYLYQLLADLAEETSDEDGQIAALENSLASAGPRRASVLRELMELSKAQPASYNTKGRKGDRDRQLAFGRRLVGLGELVPPDVYLDLGDAFLEADDEASAARTFDLTREFPDGELYQQQAAERFEKAGFVDRALDRYQAVLAASPTNVPLLAKVGELRESLGSDERALDLYMRAYEILISRKPLFEGSAEEEDERSYFARNIDEYEQYIERVLQGVLSSLADDAAVLAFLQRERAAMATELPEALAAADSGRNDKDEKEPEASFARHPRLSARAEIIRRVAFATGHASEAETLDRWAIAAFPEDEDLLDDALMARARWGRFAAARKLVDDSGADGERRDSLLARLGQDTTVDGGGGRRIAFDSAISAVLPTFASGDTESLRALVRRTDLSSVEKDHVPRLTVLFAGARATKDTELALAIGREWLRLELEHGTYSYEMENRIETILNALDSETGLALARYFVGRVLEDPEKNSQYVTLLPKLTDRFDGDVVEAEDVRAMLDDFGDGYAYGIGPVLALLPAAERAGALRTLWSKLEATNRAAFLIDLVSEMTEEVPAELADFVTDSLPDALDEADDFIKYAVSSLLDVEHSHALCATMAKQVLEANPQFDQVRASELIHRFALGEEDIAAEAAKIWVTLSLDPGNDYYKRQAREKLVELFIEDHLDAFINEIDARVEEDGDSPKLSLARVDLLLEADEDDQAGAALDSALEKEPKDEELLNRLRRLQLGRGETLAATQTLERLATVAKDDGDDAKHKRHLKALVRAWQSLNAPELALAAKLEIGDDDEGSGIPGYPAGYVLPPGAMISINGVLYTSDDFSSAKKGLPKSFDDVREALDEEDDDEAGRIFRRLWRQFPVGQPKPPRYYSARRYRNLTLSRLTWPADEEGEGADKEEDEPSKGGLLSYKPEAPEDAPEPPNAYERIAVSPKLIAEQRRFLRTVQAHELDRLQKLLEGLLSVDMDVAGGGDDGEAAVLDSLLSRADAGETGRADQIRLLAMLDRAPERVTGAAAEALAQLVQTIPPRDAAQVRRLARVLLQSGDQEIALRLYEWCALLASSSGRSFGNEETLDVVTNVSDRQLVQEARDHLEGDAMLSLIEIVLANAKPVDSPWQRENYEHLVLDTWDEVVGSVEALERSREVAEAAIDLGTGLRRRVARRAAPLFLAAGERDKALQALEVGLAKFDPADVAQPEEVWYRIDPTQEGHLAVSDLRRLLPVNGGELEDAGEWFIQFASTLEGWIAEDRVHLDNAVEALALTSVRLAEIGHEDEARELAARLGARTDLHARTVLWVVDALRASGADDAADQRERELLAAGRLHAERAPEVLSRILESDGAASAIEAAAPIAEFSRNEAFVATMIQAAELRGDEALATLWRERDAAARQAEVELEEK